METNLCKRSDQIVYILQRTSDVALYELLAEEASELAHASLKLARIMRGEVPAAKTREKAIRDVLEEYTDLRNVADVIDLPMDILLSNAKMKRWVDRLALKEADSCNSTITNSTL